MTRAECEEKILALTKEIKRVYDEYMAEEETEDEYLTIAILKDTLWFNNMYWKHEKGKVNYIYRGKNNG